jgi:hypothetical protein
MIGATVTVSSPKTKLDVEGLMAELKALSNNRVLVGVPSEKSARDFTPEEWENRKKNPIGRVNNAMLAYVHDQGSPAQCIPKRSFMKPGIAKAQSRINTEFKAAAQAMLAGNKEEMNIRLHRAGLIAQNSIRNVIRKGEGFVSLRRATLLARSRKNSSRIFSWFHLSKEEAAGMGKSQRRLLRSLRREEIMGSMHPLIDSGQLLKSIVYIVEEGK